MTDPAIDRVRKEALVSAWKSMLPREVIVAMIILGKPHMYLNGYDTWRPLRFEEWFDLAQEIAVEPEDFTPDHVRALLTLAMQRRR